MRRTFIVYLPHGKSAAFLASRERAEAFIRFLGKLRNTLRYPISFELIAEAQIITFAMAVHREDTLRTIRSFYEIFPESWIVEVEDYVTWNHEEEKVSTCELIGRRKRDFSLNKVIPLLSPDSLSLLLNIFSSSHSGTRYIFQLVLDVDEPLSTEKRFSSVGTETRFFRANIRLALIESKGRMTSSSLSEIGKLFVRFSEIDYLRSIEFQHGSGNQGFQRVRHRILDTPFALLDEEISSLYSFPSVQEHPHLLHLLSAIEPVPRDVHFSIDLSDIPKGAEVPEGALELRQVKPIKSGMFGTSRYHFARKKIGVSLTERFGHLHVVGRAGTGKTKLLEHLLLSDLASGEGAVFFDCHGDSTEEFLKRLSPEEADRVVLLDIGSRDFLPKLSLLTCPSESSRSFFSEMLSDLLSDEVGVEQSSPCRTFLARSIELLVNRDSSCMRDLLRFLTNEEFRNRVIRENQVEDLQHYFSLLGEQGSLARSPEIFGISRLLARMMIPTPLAHLFRQKEGSFHFEEILSQKKVLLIRAPKQEIGSENFKILSNILILQIHSALGSLQQCRVHLYLDEFQNIVGPTFSSLIREARDRGAAYTIAYQTAEQIPDAEKSVLRHSFQNSLAFQLGGSDAEEFATQFAPQFSAKDLVHLDPRCFYLSVVVDGCRKTPFSGRTLDLREGSHGQGELCRKKNYVNFYTSRGAQQRSHS
ncbi:type IV secretory system conjugative DNA transfer family protein [bacterium]|nr:type IV secretory system conjugative DNA transfer family protein [bacterium]